MAIQTAYAQGHLDVGASSIEDAIRSAMYRHLRDDLGQLEVVARNRADAEVEGTLGKNICDECERDGLSFRGKTVLDLGAGLGGLSVEISRRGAILAAIEPGATWRSLAARRLAGRGTIIGAVGEHLPFADNSIDLIVSRQVLEHVQSPRDVIREAFRVLKPGGYFSITYENYFSFWEPHYRVRWFPLLPKPIGAAYLRKLGRDPTFLYEAVTYTTFLTVRRYFSDAGFRCLRQTRHQQALRSTEKNNLKWKILKALASVNQDLAMKLLAAFDYAPRIFRTNVGELMQKPL